LENRTVIRCGLVGRVGIRPCSARNLCFTFGHLVGITVVPVPMDIFGSDGRSIANPVSMLLADGRWRIAHTVSPSEADYLLPFAVSAYYRVKNEG
jgi:hypothetical protein